MGDRRATDLHGARIIPATFLIDKYGVVRYANPSKNDLALNVIVPLNEDYAPRFPEEPESS